MRFFPILLARLRAHFTNARDEGRLNDEISAHIDYLAADFEARGLSPAEARFAALREFGGIVQMQEIHRERRKLPLLSRSMQDLRYALRQMRQSPGFTAAAVLTLALGIGANTAIYNTLDALILRPLPVERPQELVQVQLFTDGKSANFSYPTYEQLAARQNVLRGIYATSVFPMGRATLRTNGEVKTISAVLVTGNYFQLLGVHASFGRTFVTDDNRRGAPAVAVISDSFWERQFGRRADAIGKPLEINHAAATIVGVMPPGFFGDTRGFDPDVWLPLSVQPKAMQQPLLDEPKTYWLTLMARRKPGVSIERAQAALDALYHRIEYGGSDQGWRDRVVLAPGARGILLMQEQYETPLMLLMAVAGMALLIACCNLANLLLGRGAARAHEIGIRLALGAGRRRIVRQLFTESLALATIGGAAAFALSGWASRLLSSAASMPVLAPVESRAAVFTASVALVAACLFGLAPALATTRIDLQTALQAGRRNQTGARPRQLFGKALIVTQIAVSLLLLSGSGLLLRSFWNLRHQDFGFRPEGVLIANLPFEFGSKSESDPGAQALFDRLNSMPGVASAALFSFGPMGSGQFTGPVSSPLRSEKEVGTGARFTLVSPRYFETMGIPILSGRGITAEDREKSQKIAVLSETAAHKLFGGAYPVGRFISGDHEFKSEGAIQVVGVVRDVRFADPRDPFGILIYTPLSQMPLPVPVTTVALRASTGDPARFAPAVRAAVHEFAPARAIGEIQSLSDLIDDKLDTDLTLATLVSIFGGLALALTCVGVYGVVSYAVARRTQEFGIRIALGARRAEVIGMLLKETGTLLGLGAAVGGVGVIAGSRLMRNMLFGVAPNDYSIPAAAIAVLAFVAAAAVYIPARRAARLDPMSALREE